MAENTKVFPVSSKSVWRDPIFWFVIAVGLGYGGVRNFLPTTFPILRHELGATLKNLGQAEFLFYLSSVLIGIIGGPVLALLGLKRTAVAALAIAGGSLLLIGGAHGVNLILVCAGMLGLAIVCLVVVVGSTISAHFQERRQSVFLLAGLSDASGTMLGPAILGLWIMHAARWHLTWRSGYFAGATVLGILVIWALFVPARSMGDGLPAGEALKKNAVHTKEILRDSAFHTAVLLCFCHGLAQAGMVAFVGQLYIRRLHVDPAHAAYLLSAEGAGILAGRLIFGWITARWKIPELKVIAMCAAAETMAFTATILAPNYAVGITMFVLGGVFISAVGPSLNSYLGCRLSDRLGTAFSLFAGLGNMGAALGPYIIGVLGTDFGIERGILCAPLFGGLLSATGLIRYLRERRLYGTV
ncbi:MAG TPA: MFS transporter [Terriglobales bacterium]|jgi:MFS family permease|nr:MFS transporter [Terriglobales bacterium]